MAPGGGGVGYTGVGFKPGGRSCAERSACVAGQGKGRYIRMDNTGKANIRHAKRARGKSPAMHGASSFAVIRTNRQACPPQHGAHMRSTLTAVLCTALALLSLPAWAGTQGTAKPATGEAHPPVPHYELAYSHDGALCEHFLNIYNDDLKKYGEVREQTHPEWMKESEWVSVKDGDIRKDDNGEEYWSKGFGAKFAHVDINGDGNRNYIYKIVSSYRYEEYEVLFIIDDNQCYNGEYVSGICLYKKCKLSFPPAKGYDHYYELEESINIKRLPICITSMYKYNTLFNPTLDIVMYNSKKYIEAIADDEKRPWRIIVSVEQDRFHDDCYFMFINEQ